MVSQHLYPARAQYCKRPKVPQSVAPGSPGVVLASQYFGNGYQVLTVPLLQTRLALLECIKSVALSESREKS